MSLNDYLILEEPYYLKKKQNRQLMMVYIIIRLLQELGARWRLNLYNHENIGSGPTISIAI